MLELHENLKKILQAKNLETFYSEIYGQKIFVYVGLNLETWLFNDEKIYKLQDEE
ncbi:magnesium transporter CorA, partial [Campylobacter jejuni CVM 41936]